MVAVTAVSKAETAKKLAEDAYLEAKSSENGITDDYIAEALN